MTQRVRSWSFRLSNSSFHLSSKSQLRKILRSKRAALDPVERQAAALQVATIFANSEIFKKAQHIACYQAQGSELSLQPMIELIWQSQKKCYLPMLSLDDDLPLHFIDYQVQDNLQPNHYGILEPEYFSEKVIAAEQLDIVIVPLLGFDLNRHRLGSGSGYYDRRFSFLRQQPRPIKPYFIGGGYAFQQCDSIPCDDWDVLLDGVLTEKKLILF